jgi:hypothetical protein
VAGSANQILYKNASNIATGSTNFLFLNDSTFIVGAATSTGTASQPLQVTGSVYIAGDGAVALSIGATANTTYPIDLRLPSTTSTAAMIRIAPTTTTRPAGILYSNSGSSNMWTGVLNSSGAGQNLSGFPTYAAVVGLTAGTTPLIFATNALERVRVFDTGEVGIGTTVLTGTASQRLQVNGGAYISDNLGIGATNTSVKFEVSGGTSRFTQAGQGDVTISHSSLVTTIKGLGTVQLALGANNTETIRINTSNQVGINTTNPGATLNVVPTATSIAGLFSGTTSSDMVRITQLGSGNALVVEDSANPDSSPFVVTGIGSVGIGTASPAFTADIAGDARVTSTNKMRFGGTAGTTNFYIQYNSTANSLDFVAG